MATKTVYVVRKHVTGKKQPHQEYYPEQFETSKGAQRLLKEKEAKWAQTIEDFIEDCGDNPRPIGEGRRYEIVPMEVEA